jgi:hypothetical protein
MALEQKAEGPSSTWFPGLSLAQSRTRVLAELLTAVRFFPGTIV